MTDRLTSGSMRFLLGAACIVIISWGIKAASDLLSLVLLSLLLAYSALPGLKRLMRIFHLRKAGALALAVSLMGALGVALVVLLCGDAARLKEKLPLYEERARELYQHVAVFLQAHGFDITSLSAAKTSSSSEIVRVAQAVLPEAGRLFSDGLVVVVLGAMFLLLIAEDTGRASPGSILAQIHDDVAHYTGVLARSGVLTALANLVLLEALGVDFALGWSVLYFFLNFIPNIGFILAMVPPSCAALLMLGWKRALLVAIGLVLTELVSQYANTLILSKSKGMTVSAVETILAALWWGFLLGPAGGILAIPLTLAMKRLIPDFFIERRTAAPSG